MAKKPKLSDAEKAANVRAGLTPTGKIPKARGPGVPQANVPNTKNGINKAPEFPAGDYRSTGFAFTATRKNKYLEALAKTGERVLARMEVGISLRTEERHRSEDPLFKEGMDEALRQYGAVISKEIHRRGIEGVQEPVYGNIGGQGGGSGVVGFVTRYSDRLLLTQAQRFEPGYTPKTKVETTITKADGLGLEDLSPESQDDLRRILERELEKRGTNGTPPEPPVS